MHERAGKLSSFSPCAYCVGAERRRQRGLNLLYRRGTAHVLRVRFMEDQRGGVEAVAQSSWARAVLEDMAEMAIAARAENFDACHAMGVIGVVDDVFRRDRFEKAGPTGAGIELGISGKQWQSATDAGINTGLFVIVEDATEGRLGTFAAGDLILFGGQLLAPFGVALYDFGLQDGRKKLPFLIKYSDIYRVGGRHGFRLGVFGIRVGPKRCGRENQQQGPYHMSLLRVYGRQGKTQPFAYAAAGVLCWERRACS